MKEKIVIVLSCMMLLISHFAFAYQQRPYKGEVVVVKRPVAQPIRVACNSCGTESNNCNTCDSCAALEGCGWGGCCDSQSGPCGACSCTDPNCGRNPCISARKCCEVFGNIGAGDMGDMPSDCA